jgi:hypothetical protein
MVRTPRAIVTMTTITSATTKMLKPRLTGAMRKTPETPLFRAATSSIIHD